MRGVINGEYKYERKKKELALGIFFLTMCTSLLLLFVFSFFLPLL
jgi:hypothetical protein